MFAEWVDDTRDMERMAAVKFSVICFRINPGGAADETALENINAKILESVNSRGDVYLSHTKLKGRYCLRLAVGNLMTTEYHVRRAFELVCNEANIPYRRA